MSKVLHVSRLIHERDTLTKQRDEVDQRIAAIDAEIDRAWQGTGSISTAPTPTNGHAVSRDDDDDDDDAAEAESSSSNLAKLVAMIRASPTLDYGHAAKVLYEEDNETTRKRIRSSLSYLSRRKRLRNLGKNQWEVLA